MSKKKSPAFQFYPDSWLSSTDIQLMTPAEEGAFIRLLCHAWLQPGGGLPDDDSALAILSRLGSGWRKSAARIRRKFVVRDGRLFNERLSEERCKQEEWSRKSKQGGDKSAETRCGPKDNGGYQMVTVSPQPNGNSSSSSSSPSSGTPPSGGVPPTPAPRYEPLDEAPGPALVESTLDNLRQQYDDAAILTGDIASARGMIEQILSRAVNPPLIAASMPVSLAAHIMHWKLAGKGKELRYWLSNQEYMSTPRPPPENATTVTLGTKKLDPNSAEDARFARIVAKMEAKGL